MKENKYDNEIFFEKYLINVKKYNIIVASKRQKREKM